MRTLSLFVRSKAFDLLSLALPIVYLSELSKKSQYPFSDVDTSNQIVFIHVPKTAGSSILKQIFNLQHNGHYRPTHYLSKDKRLYESSKKVAVVRNPWDRIVSGFHYLKQGVGKGKYARKFVHDYLKDIPDFQAFVLRMMSDDKFLADVMQWDHFRPQWDFITLDDKYCIDLLGRYEDLEQFTEQFCKLIDEPYKKLKRINSSNRDDYRSYYTNEMMEFVYQIYRKEIDFLGYDY